MSEHEMSEQLPDDVLAFIKEAATGDLGWITTSGKTRIRVQAEALLDRHTPKPEALTDHGTITYTRIFQPHHDVCSYYEGEVPKGIYVDSRTLHPWPDDGGICDLLNDGRRFIRADHLGDGTVVLIFGRKPER